MFLTVSYSPKIMITSFWDPAPKISYGKQYSQKIYGYVTVSANIDDNSIISEKKNELLGIISDSKLFFEDHINKLCKNQKLKALPRVVPYLRLEKRKTVMKAFATSQFGYCPLVSTFHSRGLNYKINSLHERALRITYGDKLSSFQELLKNNNSVCIHHRNIQTPVTEMFKVNCTGNYERTFCS